MSPNDCAGRDDGLPSEWLQRDRKVVDVAYVLKAFVRNDGAPVLTVEIGRLKINTAIAFGRPSGPPP